MPEGKTQPTSSLPGLTVIVRMEAGSSLGCVIIVQHSGHKMNEGVFKEDIRRNFSTMRQSDSGADYPKTLCRFYPWGFPVPDWLSPEKSALTSAGSAWREDLPKALPSRLCGSAALPGTAHYKLINIVATACGEIILVELKDLGEALKASLFCCTSEDFKKPCLQALEHSYSP